jgi:putative glycosyltransferase (TIGR04372 family)
MKILKSFLQYSVGMFFFTISFILHPFIKIRYGILYAERLGHLTSTLDNYLYLKKEKDSKNEIAIFHIMRPISNEEILRLWKNQRSIFFFKVAKYVFYFDKKFSLNSNLIIRWKEMAPLPIKTNTIKKFIKIDKDFINKGEKIISENKISEPYICFTNRDSEYLKHSADQNYFDYKDCQFSDFDKSIRYLIKNNQSVIRIGKKTNTEYFNPDKNFHSLTDENRTDFSDIYHLYNSKYNIHGSTHGIQAVSAVFRKKSLNLNFTPFNLYQLTSLAKGSCFIPKKIFHKQKKKFLKFNEISKIEEDIHYKGNYYSDNQLEFVNNTDEEILNAVKEFDQNFYNEEYNVSQLQENFWNSLINSETLNLVKNKLKIRICESFLKTNKDLI